jgi:pimeloyl-ACP methyl ester carboxylesterase
MLLEIGLKHWRVVQGFVGPTSLAAITSPTQVIYGSRDLLVLPANAEVLHRHIPRSVLTRVEGAGHEMTLDRGADVAAAIEAFIQGLAQGERVA